MQVRARKFDSKLVAHIWGEKRMKEIVVGKSDMRQFGKPRHRWKDYVKFLRRGRGLRVCERFSEAYHSDQCWDRVNPVVAWQARSSLNN